MARSYAPASKVTVSWYDVAFILPANTSGADDVSTRMLAEAEPAVFVTIVTGPAAAIVLCTVSWLTLVPRSTVIAPSPAKVMGADSPKLAMLVAVRTGY